MIILGIETATQQVGCAVGGQEGVFAEFHAARDRRHAEILTPAIKFVCEQARVELSEISVIAVDIGPGLYTGLRVGISTAKAMAQALRVPMLGFSSLDLIALQARHSRRLIIPMIDAKRGEIFAARYQQVSGGVQRVSDYTVTTAEKLSIDIEPEQRDVLIVGDGAIRYASLFAPMKHVKIGTADNAFPSATALVTLAHPLAVREEYVQPREIIPMYLRQSDAEINWQRDEDDSIQGG